MGHTANFDPKVKCMYVFGGSKNLRWFNDIHVLDLKTWKWSLVKVSGEVTDHIMGDVKEASAVQNKNAVCANIKHSRYSH